MPHITRHKTAAIIGTVTPVPNYPKKLKVYLNNASPYWQSVYWDNGKTYRQSTKETDKREAFKKAITLYEQIILSKYQHPAHLTKHNISTKKDNNTLDINTRFQAIALQWVERKETTWTTRHTRNVISRLQTYLLGSVGEKDITQVTSKEILSGLQKLEAKGHRDAAHRLLNNCKNIWQYAIAIGVCKKDITVGLNQVLHTPITTHQHAVPIPELPKLMCAINIRAKKAETIHFIALEIIAHTFVRTSELLEATWDEFNIEKALWTIPAQRMKMRIEHTVPLTSYVINLLKCVQINFPNTHHVIHVKHSDKLLAPDALVKQLHKIGYKGRMSTHGFRAIASTVLNENGFRADAIERQLAHTEHNQVRRAYNRAEYLDERVAMMDWWSNYLVTCCKNHTG
jgi:integrase